MAQSKHLQCLCPKCEVGPYPYLIYSIEHQNIEQEYDDLGNIHHVVKNDCTYCHTLLFRTRYELMVYEKERNRRLPSLLIPLIWFGGLRSTFGPPGLISLFDITHTVDQEWYMALCYYCSSTE